MYSYYAKMRRIDKDKYLREFLPSIEEKYSILLYDERTRYMEILVTCLELQTYLIVLSLNASKSIDTHNRLHVTDSFISYGRNAMQEILVIRIRDLLNAEKDRVSKFKIHGFHNSLKSYGIDYPIPNTDVNNAIARIITRRNNYSAHHGNGLSKYSYSKNLIKSLDLAVALTYLSKVEENLHSSKVWNPFEILMNEELEVDMPLTIHDIYKTLSGKDYEHFDIKEDDYILTEEFKEYHSKVIRELSKIRSKVDELIGIK